jgi:hypothetical protein
MDAQHIELVKIWYCNCFRLFRTYWRRRKCSKIGIIYWLTTEQSWYLYPQHLCPLEPSWQSKYMKIHYQNPKIKWGMFGFCDEISFLDFFLFILSIFSEKIETRKILTNNNTDGIWLKSPSGNYVLTQLINFENKLLQVLDFPIQISVFLC